MWHFKGFIERNIEIPGATGPRGPKGTLEMPTVVESEEEEGCYIVGNKKEEGRKGG